MQVIHTSKTLSGHIVTLVSKPLTDGSRVYDIQIRATDTPKADLIVCTDKTREQDAVRDLNRFLAAFNKAVGA